MTNYQKIFLTIGLIILSNLLGHFLAPSSIFLTPIVVGATTALLTTSTLNFPIRILLILLAVIANDLLVKSFAGGTHDFEGAGLINLFLIVGIIISTIITFATSIEKERFFRTTLASLIIVVVLYFHLNYFDFLGLSYTKNESITKEISKKEGIFLKELSFSENQISYNGDSIKLLNGWIEKQQIVDHTGLFRKNVIGQEINFIIKVQSNKSPYDSNLLYKVGSRDMNGSSSIDSVIKFSSMKPNCSLYFFSSSRGTKDLLIKEIKINSQ